MPRLSVAAEPPPIQTAHPVALVSELPGSARIRRTGLHTQIALYLGDLIFPGDAIIASQGAVSISFCPASAIYSLTSGETSVTEKRVLTDNQKDAIPARHLPFPCRLPAITPQSYLDVRAGADRLQNSAVSQPSGDAPVSPELTAHQKDELDSLNAFLLNNPKDMPALLARAMALEAANDLVGSARDYDALSKLAPKAGWISDELNAVIARRDRRASSEGKIIAVVIGISSYKNADHANQIDNLQFADRDAAVFYDYLTSPRGGARPADVTLLVNEQAELDSMRLAINEAFARARPQDKVVLFISAHGFPLDKPPNSGAYIAPYNADLNDPARTMFRMEDLQQVTDDTLRPDWIQLYADTCHAGLIGGVDTRKENLFLATFVDKRRKDMKILGLFASRQQENSYECSNLDQGHGAFTYFLLKGLNSNEALSDTLQITVESLDDYIETNVKALTKGLKPRQSPFMMTPNDIGSEKLVANPDLPGIKIGSPTGPNTCTSSRGLRTTKLAPPEQSGLHDVKTAALAAQLNAGQDVLLRYLQGEAIAPTRDDFARGEAAFSAASKLQGGADPFTESRLLFCTGRKLIFDKNYQQAIITLEESIRKDPLGAYSYNALGIAYLETPDYPKAVEAFEDAVRLAPYWAYAHHNLALALAQAGQYQRAIAAYQQAMKLAPSYAYIAFNFGLLYEHLNRPADARSLWFQLVKINPNMSRAWNAIGLSYALEGDRSKAEEYYRRALAAATDKTDRLAVKHDLALLLRSERRDDEALSLWRENLAENPADLPSLVGISEALYNRGDATAATAIFVDLLKEKPDFIGARLQYAKLLAKSGKDADATASAQQLHMILEKAPTNADACELLADLLSHQLRRTTEDVGAARDLYSRAIANAASGLQRRRLQAKRLKLTSY